jgi:glycosyltransferase involved in cell wall biosynthesis
LFPSKLVFDSFDKFAMAFIPPRHRILYRWVDSFENILTSKVDAFITVSNERLRIFPSIPALSAIVMNCPDGYPSLGSDRQNALDGADLVLVYAGSIARDRGLVEVSRALSSFENVRFLVAGRVIDRDTFDELNQNPKVQYLGMLDGDAAIALQQRADLIPIIYDQSIPINRVASPNKLFEAMMIKVPVISNVCTDLVNEIGCGIVVSGTVGSIANAISFALGNRNALRAMGDKGFSAWQISYNWTSMKQRLFDVYDKVSKFD